MLTARRPVHVPAAVLSLLALSPVADAAGEQKTTSLFAQNTVYVPHVQNPGAPNEILQSAPDEIDGEEPMQLSVNGRTVTVGQPLFQAAYRERRPSPRFARHDLMIWSEFDIDRAPFDILRAQAPSGSSGCIVDFNDEDALAQTALGFEYNVIYMPWWQQCGSNAGTFVDIRPLVYSHFHLGFEDPNVLPCPDPGADYYPSRIDEDGNCDFVDILTEPRTYLASHLPDEFIRIRLDGLPGTPRTFSLNRLRIASNNAVRLCYHKDQEVDLEWEAAGPGGSTSPGLWLCWSELTPGTWDLSNWVWDVTEVKVTGAESASAGPFSLDDIHIAID